MKIQLMNNDKDFKESVSKLYKDYGIPKLLSEIILNRNNNIDFAKNIAKNNDRCIIAPELLPHAQEVAERIAYHIIKGSKIYVYADYDCDGINSGFIIHDVVRNIIRSTPTLATIEIIYPERNAGYGISNEFVDKVINEASQYSNKTYLVLTVDNGISKALQINKLNSVSNIEAIVTDHHPADSQPPDCLICDPNNMLDELNRDGKYSHLCGAGVVFKICQLLQRLYKCEDMEKYTANLAIATIADVMPFTEENIALIAYGIRYLNSDKCPKNFKSLIENLRIPNMNSTDIAWSIAPMINAAGRMKNTELAKCFIESERLDQKKIDDYVSALDKTNKERKSMTKKISESIFSNPKIYENKFVICVIKNMPAEGIVGVIAGKISDTLDKPCMVVMPAGKNLLSGSIRCPEDINLKALLNKELEAGTIVSYGGHNSACGVCIYESEIDRLQENLNKYVRIPKVVVPADTIYIDSIITLQMANMENYKTIYSIPYNGDTFPVPVFEIKNCSVVEGSYKSTKTGNGKWITVTDSSKSYKESWIDNELSELYESLGQPEKINIIVTLERNFKNTNQCGIKIKYIEKAE